MFGKWLKKRVGLILILFFCFSIFVFGQDKQDEQDKQLREEILSIYQSKGEPGLRDFVRKQKDKISNSFIVDFAEMGMKGRKEKWLKACEIIAELKKDEKVLADVFLQLGEYFRLVPDYKKATVYFEKALPLYVELDDLAGQGDVFYKLGVIYFYTGENQKAMKMYDKAILFFKRIGNIIGQGNAIWHKGRVYFYTGDNARALNLYDNALPFFEKAGDIVGQGNVFWSKGDVYFYTGENDRAFDAYDKALPFYEKAGDPRGQGNVFKSKGDIYSYTGDNSKAVEMYDKALPLFKKEGNVPGQANVYLSKGYAYLSTAETAKALEMCEKAIFFYDKSDNPWGQGNVYFVKGEIFFRVGDNSNALKMYDKALPFYEKAGYLLGQGNVYQSKGYLYFKMNKNLNALEMNDNALHFFEKVGEPRGQGNGYFSKGDIYSKMGQYSRAFEMYHKALPLYKKAGSLLGQGNVYRSKGEISFLMGDNSSALEMFDKALQYYTKIGEIESESYIFHQQAKVLVQQSKKDEALSLFEQGISKLEKVRTRTLFSEIKSSFMEKVYKQYEETVLFMLENTYCDKGFKYAELMKARVFLDRMTEGLVRLDKGLASNLKEKRNNLVGKLSLYSKKVHETTGGKDEKKLQELKEQYRKVEDAFEELLVRIRLDNPLYASVRYPEPLSHKDLQREVLKKGELLLSYFVSGGKVYVFLVSKEDFKVVTLKSNPVKLNKVIEQFLTSINGNNHRSIRKYGKQLYKKLFKPLEASIKGKRNVIIVPDGELAKIPFETLIEDSKTSRKPVYLMEKYRIKYIQSASILSILRKHYQRDRTTNHFIGFGDPVYDYKNFKQGKPEHGTPNPIKGDEITEIHRGKYHREGGKLVRLEASGEEVNTIAQLFKKHNQKCVVHVREQATEANAKAADLKDFDYIHFSCHGILGDGFQSLVLSQLPPEKSSEDGYFTLNEIMNCDYNAKLVVLSACQTGSGKMYRGEGVMGLTRAVMYAGTPAVVASLWDVDDRATKELMVTFYRNMLEKNMDKVEALRQAKLELLKTQTFSSPYFWSAFVLYGE